MNFWDWLIKEGENPLITIGSFNLPIFFQASATGPFVHYNTVKDWLEAKQKQWYKTQDKYYQQSYLRKHKNGAKKSQDS